jgi:hypothetical protein
MSEQDEIKKIMLREALSVRVRQVETLKEELAEQKQQNEFLMALLVDIYENSNTILDYFSNDLVLVEAVIYEGRPAKFGGGEASLAYATEQWEAFKQLVLEGKKPTKGV